MKHKIFLSGPFTGSCPYLRRIIKTVFSPHDVEILVKHAGVEETAASLMKEADAVMFVYGTAKSDAEDVWGRSLVELEMRYASAIKKKALACFIGATEDAGSGIKELRYGLEQNLGEGVLVFDELSDEVVTGDDRLFWEIGIELAEYQRYDTPLSDKMTMLLEELLPESLRDKLLDKATLAQTFEQIVKINQMSVPTIEQIDTCYEGVERLAEGWQEKARFVFSDRIFISYSSKDFGIAERLESFLKDKGYSPWLDKSRLKAGEIFAAELEEAIKFSGAFVVLLTEDAKESDWVEKEIEEALGCERRYGAEHYFILPLSIEGSDPEDIGFLSDRHQITIGKEGDSFLAGANKLVADLKERLSQEN